VWVVGISKGSAADVAGLEQGDQLIAVGGRQLEGVSPFQASALISTPWEEEGEAAAAGSSNGSSSSSSSTAAAAAATAAAGSSSGDTQQSSTTSTSSTVPLTVRKASGRVEEFAVPRPVTQLASPVRYSLQARASGRKVGVVAIKSFTARAQRDVAAAVAELQERGAQELELDLRDNRCVCAGGGGSDACSVFLTGWSAGRGLGRAGALLFWSCGLSGMFEPHTP